MTTLTAPVPPRYRERMSETVAYTRRWSRAEYEQMIEAGLFRPDERLELLDGLLASNKRQIEREKKLGEHGLELGILRRVAEAIGEVVGEACARHRYPRPALTVSPSRVALLPA